METNQNRLFHHLGRLNVGDLRVATISDATKVPFFSAQSHILELEPAHWRTQLIMDVPHFVMIESIWQGEDGLEALRDLLLCCRANKIPTAFWHREDVSQIAATFAVAALVDFVYATDLASIPVYKYLLKHSRVFYLPRDANDKADGPRALTDVVHLPSEMQEEIEKAFVPKKSLKGGDIEKTMKNPFEYIKLELFSNGNLGMYCFKSAGTDYSKMFFHRLNLAPFDRNLPLHLFFGALAEGNVRLEVRYYDGERNELPGKQMIAPMCIEVLCVPANAVDCTLAICVRGIAETLISAICLF
ncbi:MAG: hypothetical protein WCL54_02190 [Clostridia bacterium]